MFTLCVSKLTSGAYGFTIVKPDTCFVSGSRETLTEVYQELDQVIQKWELKLSLEALDKKNRRG